MVLYISACWMVGGLKDTMHLPAGLFRKKRTFSNQDLQDDIDARNQFIICLNMRIVLLLFINEHGFSSEWISLIKNTMVRIAPEFTMKRQIDDYFEKYYTKLWERSKTFIDNNFEKAKELAAWKKNDNQWNGIILRC